jgi:hypothetical protein
MLCLAILDLSPATPVVLAMYTIVIGLDLLYGVARRDDVADEHLPLGWCLRHPLFSLYVMCSFRPACGYYDTAAMMWLTWRTCLWDGASVIDSSRCM